MTIKKNVFTSIAALASIGIIAGFGGAASAGDCFVPDLVAGANPFVIPISAPIKARCVGGAVTAEGTAPAGNSTTVRANLVVGSFASSGGYRANRTFINGCVANDNTANGVVVSDACPETVFFHDLMVLD